jgi:hypothetical protein
MRHDGLVGQAQGYPEANQRLSDIYPTNRKCLELGHMGGRQKEE